MIKIEPENVEKIKKAVIVGGGLLIAGFGLQVIFDNSGQANQPVEIPKNIVEAPVPETPEQPYLQQVSETRKQGWKEIKKVCGQNLQIDSGLLDQEIRIARAQQWLKQSQNIASTKGTPNLEFLEEQFSLYAGRAQAIAQYNGADQLNIADAKTISRFREYKETALDIATAIELLGNSTEPRPTVTTGQFKEAVDGCLNEIKNYGAINEEQLRKIQEAVMKDEQQQPVEPETGSAQAGEPGEDDEL